MAIVECLNLLVLKLLSVRGKNRKQSTPFVFVHEVYVPPPNAMPINAHRCAQFSTLINPTQPIIYMLPLRTDPNRAKRREPTMPTVTNVTGHRGLFGAGLSTKRRPLFVVLSLAVKFVSPAPGCLRRDCGYNIRSPRRAGSSTNERSSCTPPRRSTLVFGILYQRIHVPTLTPYQERRLREKKTERKVEARSLIKDKRWHMNRNSSDAPISAYSCIHR